MYEKGKGCVVVISYYVVWNHRPTTHRNIIILVLFNSWLNMNASIIVFKCQHFVLLVAIFLATSSRNVFLVLVKDRWSDFKLCKILDILEIKHKKPTLIVLLNRYIIFIIDRLLLWLLQLFITTLFLTKAFANYLFK